MTFASIIRRVGINEPHRYLHFNSTNNRNIPKRGNLSNNRQVTTTLLNLGRHLASTPVRPRLIISHLTKDLRLLLVLILNHIRRLTSSTVIGISSFVNSNNRTFSNRHCRHNVTSLRLRLYRVDEHRLTAFADSFRRTILIGLPLSTYKRVGYLPKFRTLGVFRRITEIQFNEQLTRPYRPHRFATILTLRGFIRTLAIK